MRPLMFHPFHHNQTGHYLRLLVHWKGLLFSEVLCKTERGLTSWVFKILEFTVSERNQLKNSLYAFLAFFNYKINDLKPPSLAPLFKRFATSSWPHEAILASPYPIDVNARIAWQCCCKWSCEMTQKTFLPVWKNKMIIWYEKWLLTIIK